MTDCDDHIWIYDEKEMTHSPKELAEGQFLMRKICSNCGTVNYDKCSGFSNKKFFDRYFQTYNEVYDKFMPGKWVDIKDVDKE